MTSVATALGGVRQLPPLQRILVIENDRAIQVQLQRLFHYEGYEVEIAGAAAESRKLVHHSLPSVLILDLQLAGSSPRQSFEDTRSVYPCVPIIVLGTSSSPSERVLFLELGADDYVVKPFNGRELLARARAAIRRSQAYVRDTFAFGDVQVDFRRMEVRRQGRLVRFTAQEFRVLKFMTSHPERPISRAELLNEVWGYQNYPTTRTVDNHILKLRQKLEPEPSRPQHFLTVHCVGYKFVPRSGRRYSGYDIDHEREASLQPC